MPLYKDFRPTSIEVSKSGVQSEVPYSVMADELEKEIQVSVISEHVTTIEDLSFVEDWTRKNEESDLLWVKTLQRRTLQFFTRYGEYVKKILLIALLMTYTVYFILCLGHRGAGATALIVLTSVVVILVTFDTFKRHCGRHTYNCLLGLARPLQVSTFPRQALCWWLYVAVIIALVVYLALIIKDTSQIRALCGYFIFISLTLITSKHVTQIRWRPVVWGLGVQVVLALLLLRVRSVFVSANWISHNAAHFLRHSLRGAVTAFGNPLAFLHPLFMIATPVVIYASAVAFLASFVGLTPYVAKKVAWVLRLAFNMSFAESFSLADDIFSGMMDYVTRVRPYVTRLTKSEFLTALVGAHSNLFGLMYAFFTILWVDPRHLMMGAIAALPAGIALSKINYPETQQTKFLSMEAVNYDRRGKRNICEALSKGTLQGARIAGSIVIQVISFMAIYELFDVIIKWFGQQLEADINLQVLFSHIFLPFSFLTGVPISETGMSAYIIGLGLSQNEVLAYLELGSFRLGKQITDKSAAITTVAICGFSSFASMCIVTGKWSSRQPGKYREAIGMLYRVYLITHMSCMTTACLVGIFYDEDMIQDFEKDLQLTYSWMRLGELLSLIPSYKDVLSWLGV